MSDMNTRLLRKAAGIAAILSPSLFAQAPCTVMQPDVNPIAAFDSNLESGGQNPLPLQGVPALFGTTGSRWVAFKFDGTKRSNLGQPCPFSQLVGGEAPLPIVTRVELATNSPSDRVVRCALFSGTGLPASLPNAGNRWNGWLRIPAGTGPSVAEFYAESTIDPPRWFAVEMPDDVLFGERRTVLCGFTGTMVPRNFQGGVLVSTTDPNGAAWSTAPTGFDFFDLRVYRPPFVSGRLQRFVSGIPQLEVVGPTVVGGQIDMLITRTEQSTPNAQPGILLLSDVSPTLTPALQGINPMLNGLCLSLPVGPASVFVPVFASNQGNGTQLNPISANSGRLEVPITDPAFSGISVNFQMVAVTQFGGQVALRPSNVVNVMIP